MVFARLRQRSQRAGKPRLAFDEGEQRLGVGMHEQFLLAFQEGDELFELADFFNQQVASQCQDGPSGGQTGLPARPSMSRTLSSSPSAMRSGLI